MNESFLNSLGLNAADLASGPLLAIFDRDGTIAPIANNPAEAGILEAARQNLIRLSELPDVTAGVLSARALRQLRFDFTDTRLILAGNYGMEIDFSGQSEFYHAQAGRSKDALALVNSTLSSGLRSETKIILEDHELSLCLHWHRTPADKAVLVHAAVDDIRKSFPQLKVRVLETSYEFLPPFDWDKSCALEEIKRVLGREDWLYLYAGDSVNDEPAFQWVNSHGGITFGVGRPPESQAQHRLQSPNELAQLLGDLVALRTQSLI